MIFLFDPLVSMLCAQTRASPPPAPNPFPSSIFHRCMLATFQCTLKSRQADSTEAYCILHLILPPHKLYSTTICSVGNVIDFCLFNLHCICYVTSTSCWKSLPKNNFVHKSQSMLKLPLMKYNLLWSNL